MGEPKGLTLQKGVVNDEGKKLHEVLNPRLVQINKEFQSIYEKYNGDITKEKFLIEIKQKLFPSEYKTPEESPKDFMGMVGQFVEERKKSIGSKRGTWKHFNTTYNHLKNYCKLNGYYDKKNEIYTLDFKHIDKSFRNSFVQYLYSDHQEFKKKAATINYAAKELSYLSQFLNEAIDRDLTDIQTHKKKYWHLKKTPTNKFRLTFDELDQLYKFNYEDQTLQNVVDLFLISAYTGLRWSDFSKLKESNFTIEDGIEVLNLTTLKTTSGVVIPLMPQLKVILKKHNYNVPKMLSQTYNRKLKEALKLAGINKTILWLDTTGGVKKNLEFEAWEKASSHLGRRSFASNFYELGVPIMILLKITTHATQKQFFGYICTDKIENAKNFLKEVSARMPKQTVLKSA